MSDKQVPSRESLRNPSPELEAQIKHRQQVMGGVIDQIKPWLLEFGNWSFGGLIAFNLFSFAPLLTVSADHPAIILSVVIFACAMPLNVSGLFVLKMTKDLNTIAIDDMMKQAFQNADGTPADEAQSIAQRRTDVGLRYAMQLSIVSAILTVLGMVAALWYVGWWVALIFIVVVIVTLLITRDVLTRLMRPNVETNGGFKLRDRKQNTH
jgi:ABC-type multidrug transport system fused ATPase/permease subunit